MCQSLEQKHEQKPPVYRKEIEKESQQRMTFTPFRHLQYPTFLLLVAFIESYSPSSNFLSPVQEAPATRDLRAFERRLPKGDVP